MKVIVFLSLFGLLGVQDGLAQSIVSTLKKKQYGMYEGQIPAYSFLSDTTKVEVVEIPIRIFLSPTEAKQQVGLNEQVGTYTVLFKEKFNYVIEVHFEDGNQERWMLNEKSKSLLREGTTPQPAATLTYKKMK